MANTTCFEPKKHICKFGFELYDYATPNKNRYNILCDLYRKEIVFVGVRREERIYVQVCVELPTESTRETDNLMEIKDHYHKYAVCRDPLAIGNDNGIEIVHKADFLLRENW